MIKSGARMKLICSTTFSVAAQRKGKNGLPKTPSTGAPHQLPPLQASSKALPPSQAAFPSMEPQTTGVVPSSDGGGYVDSAHDAV